MQNFEVYHCWFGLYRLAIQLAPAGGSSEDDEHSAGDVIKQHRLCSISRVRVTDESDGTGET